MVYIVNTRIYLTVTELRKIQKVGYSTLTVSIPSNFAKRTGLKSGDVVIVREETDGTLRLIPRSNNEQVSKITIKLEGSDDVLIQRVIQGCYALGFDRIELVSKEIISENVLEKCKEVVRHLRGLEIVESDAKKLIIQSFMDPTKFPVDGLIKRLQLLVSQSLESMISSLEKTKIDAVKLNEVKRTFYEVENLYWLIVRQLLVALNRRELSGEIGIESPLHAAGDRVVAKALVEIGNMVSEIAEEFVYIRERKLVFEKETLDRLRALAKNVGDVFEKTVEAFLTPEPSLIREAMNYMEKALESGRSLNRLESTQPSSVRILVSYFIGLARYCNIINEISLHRLLRKSGEYVSIQL